MTRVLGLSACAVGVAAMAARMVHVTNHPMLFAAVFAPYLMLALPIGAGVLLLGRRWVAGSVAAVLTVAAAATQLPPRADTGDGIRVLSANILQGAADPATLVALAGDHADVVSIQELTPQALKALSDNGIDTTFPHRLTKPLQGGSGAGLWSRHPLTETPDGEFEGLPIIARLGVAGSPTVVVAHLSAPWPWTIEWWREDIARATTVLHRLTGPVIAAGDFNSTRDIAQFRALLAGGFRDATARTYPAGRWFPPLLAIDHVIARGASPSSATTFTIPGSDHRAVLAAVHVPA